MTLNYNFLQMTKSSSSKINTLRLELVHCLVNSYRKDHSPASESEPAQPAPQLALRQYIFLLNFLLKPSLYDFDLYEYPCILMYLHLCFTQLGGHLTLTNITQHTNTPTAGRRGATLSLSATYLGGHLTFTSITQLQHTNSRYRRGATLSSTYLCGHLTFTSITQLQHTNSR